MAETIVLDPASIAAGRTELDITAYVAEAGPDWGDAEIQAVVAEAQLGQLPVDFRLPPRTITIPLLLLGTSGGLTFEQIRAKIQAKVSLFQREGGWIRRTTSVGPLYADITNCTLHMGGGTAQALWGIDADAVLTLTAIPDFYGNELVGTTKSAAASEGDMSVLLGAQVSAVALALSPALYWRMGSLGTVADASGNGRAGTVAGSTTLITPGALANDADGALVFDGATGRVTSTYNPFVNGTIRTFSGWASRDTNTSVDTLFGSSSTVAGAWVRLSIASGSNDVVFTPNGSNQYVWPGAWPGTAQWVHWALVFNQGVSQSVAQLYINGAPLDIINAVQSYNATPGNFQVAARSTTSDPFDGMLDEIMVFTRGLIRPEIRALYQAGLSDPAVAGNYPARARIIVNELGGKNQLGLIWGVRSRHYDPLGTAALAYDCGVMTPITPATAGNGVMSLGNLASAWTAVLSTDVVGLGALTHIGSYRVWAKLTPGSTTTVPPSVRLVWDVGDLTLPIANPAVQLPGTGNASVIVDLGEIRIDQAPIGLHRWRGVIQALAGDSKVTGIVAEKLYFQPLDEGAGVITAPACPTVGLTGYAALDEFDQTAGNLTGKALPVGGTWTVVSGSHATDLVVDATNHWVSRSVTADSGVARLVTASGPTMTSVVTQLDFACDKPPSGVTSLAQVLFRYVDAANYGYIYVARGNYNATTLQIGARVASSNVPMNSITVPDTFTGWWTLRVMALANGSLYSWLYPQGSVPPVTPTTARTDSFAVARFATGNVLASGKVGWGDEFSGSDSLTRYYDNFSAWVPDIDAVIFANKGAELRYDGMFRDSSDAGGHYSSANRVIGDLPRIPPSGLEARPVELFLKSSEGDLDQASDPSISRLSVQVRYRPSYLYVAEG